MAYGLFNTYAPLIAALPDDTPLLRSDLLVPAFLLEREGSLEVYYVPFELINKTAKVMLVGITPGWTQMEIAYEVARDGLRRGKPTGDILQDVEDTASFAGTMRTNLVSMLDCIDLPRGVRYQDHRSPLRGQQQAYALDLGGPFSGLRQRQGLHGQLTRHREDAPVAGADSRALP